MPLVSFTFFFITSLLLDLDANFKQKSPLDSQMNGLSTTCFSFMYPSSKKLKNSKPQNVRSFVQNAIFLTKTPFF